MAPAKVVLNLTLTATKGPLDVGEVTAEVTFGGDDFAKVLTLPATVFNIRPAQCELLFPVVTVMGDWNTAISVTNPAYDGRNGGRRSDVHLLWDRGSNSGGDV